MARMRSLPEAYRELKTADPNTCLTLPALRRWAKEGTIKTVKVGRIPLCNLDELENLLQGGDT